MDSTTIFGLLFFACLIGWIVVLEKNRKLQRVIMDISDPKTHALIAPYQYAVYYGMLLKKESEKRMASDRMLLMLWNNSNLRYGHDNLDSFISYCKSIHIISQDYNKPIDYVSMTELKNNYAKFEAIFQEFNKR